MSPKQFRGIASTTHRDRQGERVTKDALEQFAGQFPDRAESAWGYWNHLTSLPPTMLATKEYVEPRDDGEHQLVVEGFLFAEDDYQNLAHSGVVIKELLTLPVPSITPPPMTLGQSEILVAYNPHSIDRAVADSIILAIGEEIPTARELHIEKGLLGEVVVFITIQFIDGFIQRFGELAADGVHRLGSQPIKRLANRLTELINSGSPNVHKDVILSYVLKHAGVVVEGAIEDAGEAQIGSALIGIPQMQRLALGIIENNREHYFSHIKLLFNHVTL
jgi:hypothetical protein